MLLTDHTQFREQLMGVYDFYGRELSEFALNVWWKAMRQYDLAAIADAFGRHLLNPDSGQFMPKPADIVRMMGGTSLDSAMTAWSKVDQAVRHVGSYPDVVFDDPLIHRVVHDMGGWIQLCDKNEKDWPFIGREFETRYRGYKARNEIPAYPALLIGICNAQNGQKGFERSPPVLVGDAKKAQSVLTGGADAPLVTFTRVDANSHQGALLEISHGKT